MGLLTRELLHDLGIELSDEEFTSLSTHFDTTLQDRVITEVVEELTPEQAEELSTLDGQGDDALLAWLQANVTSFQEIVSDEVDILLGELAENSEAF